VDMTLIWRDIIQIHLILMVEHVSKIGNRSWSLIRYIYTFLTGLQFSKKINCFKFENNECLERYIHLWQDIHSSRIWTGQDANINLSRIWTFEDGFRNNRCNFTDWSDICTLVGYEQYNMSNNSRYYSLIGGNCENYEHLWQQMYITDCSSVHYEIFLMAALVYIEGK
jgi:hypothetical protein